MNRQQKKQLFSQYDDIIKNFFKKINSLKFDYFVKGGKAWEANFSSVFPDSAAFKSTNYDVEFFVTNENVLKSVMTTLFKTLNETMKELKSHGLIINGKKQRIQWNLILTQNINNDGTPKLHEKGNYKYETEVIRPGFAMMIESNIPKIGKNFFLYCPIYYYGDFKISPFYSNYTTVYTKENHVLNNVRILNPRGLYLHMLMIQADRQEKEINVDKIRREKLLQMFYVNDEVVFFELKLYENTFDGSLFFDDFVIYTMLESYANLKIPNFTNISQSFFVEYYRPYLNAIIAEFNQEIQRQGLNSICFVAGGDAFRRFIPGAETMTADIDAKIYYTHEKDRASLIKIACKICSKYIIEFNKHSYEKNKYTILKDKHLIENVFSFGNFSKTRLRAILKSGDHWPVDLVSIDYRYRTNLLERTMELSYGLLDLAILKVDSIRKDDYILNPVNQFAYASRQFLKHDLEVTLYQNPALRKVREFVGKLEKNQRRLSQISSNEFNNSMHDTLNTVVFLQNNNVENQENAKQYYNIFIKQFIRGNSIMKNKDRIKYPFSIRKMLTKLKLTQNEKQIVSNRFVSMNRPLNKDIRDVRKQKRTRNNNNIQRNAKIPKLNLRGVKRTRNNTNKSNNNNNVNRIVKRTKT